MNISVQVDDFAFHLLSQRLIFLTPLLLAAGRAYAISLMSVWMSVCHPIATPLTVFLQFSRNLATLSMCQYAKNCGTDFRNFDFTVFGIFLKFYFQITTPLTVFLRFSRNLAHVIYVSICKKNCGTDFQNLAFKFFG